jgi:hypothetical protein
VLKAALAAAAGSLVLATAAPPVDASSAGATGWSNTSLTVVGGPVVADGRLLVVDVSPELDLQLSAVAVLTGKVMWSVAISPSYIPPVVVLAPVVVGNTALAMVPADADPRDRNVVLEGVNVTTGRVSWQDKQTPTVTDAPVTCDRGQDFCVAEYGAKDKFAALAVIDPLSGAILSTVDGPARNMGVAETGVAAKGDLWSTYSQTPTLMQLSPAGKVLWHEAVAKVFGGKQYNPEFGWDFVARGGTEVGSVGYPPTGDDWDLNGFKTVGLSVANGGVEWSRAGFYLCGGALQFLSDDVLCDFSGTVTMKDPLTFSGMGVTFQGLDVASGKTTWSVRASDAEAVVEGAPEPFVDGRHFVVQTALHTWAVLDTTDGSTAPVGAGEVFWCDREIGYKVTAPAGASEKGARASGPVFAGCSETGGSEAGGSAHGLPVTQPAAVGVDADGLFVWLGPAGLEAAPLS